MKRGIRVCCVEITQKNNFFCSKTAKLCFFIIYLKTNTNGRHLLYVISMRILRKEAQIDAAEKNVEFALDFLNEEEDCCTEVTQIKVNK